MTKPYCIGSNSWPGLSKLMEEMGEVQQIAGKIIGAEGEDIHFSGMNLREEMKKELGDLTAAIHFFIIVNNFDPREIIERCDHKAELFWKWHREQK